VIERALRSDPVARYESAVDLASELARAATATGLLPAPPWQVSAWVREHVEARKRGAEAHLRASRWRERGAGFSRVPEVAPKPRRSDLSVAAAVARARGRRGGAANRTPTPLADARDVLGATSAGDALGRLDAVLSFYDRGEEPPPEPERRAGEEARRPVSAGEVVGFALALVALIAILAAIILTWRAGDDRASEPATSESIVSSPSRLIS
jgi:hypothetical protein